MKFLFTCGGTAGHINPALAVASHLKENIEDSEFLFVGVEGKMEMELVPNAGFNIVPLSITNIKRGFSLNSIAHNIKTCFNVIKSFFRSIKILREFKPDVVIGTGGYVCFPVVMAADYLKIPTVIHESNAYPGLTTRMLSKYADRILVGVKESKSYYQNSNKVVCTGTPVREEFLLFNKESARRSLGLPLDKKVVLSFWGSLGAEVMNKTIIDMIPMINGEDFILLHATGTKYYDYFIDCINNSEPKYNDKGIEIFKYIHDMPALMTAADLVVCRGGASTLSELCYIGKPSIIVPSPNVTDNHQEKNARVIEKINGTKVLLEKDITSKLLYETIISIVSNEDSLNCMSVNAKMLSNDKSVENICNEILSCIN